MLKIIAKLTCAAALAAALTVPASAAGLASFIGTWVNTNPATRGIVKIVITQPAMPGAPLSVNVYGACVPTACNWGSQPAVAYAPSVSSNLPTEANALTVDFNPGFAVNMLTIMQDGPYLRVTDFTRFTDNSHRTNYDQTETFKK
jgi:hypothetical protein